MAIMITDEWKKRVPRMFPQLVEGVTFEFTSEVSYNYNCLSWALSYEDKYLEDGKGCYWPWKHISDSTVEGWVQVCEIHGFTTAITSDFQPGYEKIAIFENEEGVSHACRQNSVGKWKSKLGAWGPDIDHHALETLEEQYGKVVWLLQKRRPDWDSNI